MICFPIEGFLPACPETIAGGVMRVFVFDPADFTFTKHATRRFLYGTMAPVTGTGVPDPFDPKIHEVKFKKGGSASYTQTQGVAENGGDSWEHVLAGNLVPVMTPELSAWINDIQRAGSCCGLGVIVMLNSGESIVAGEIYNDMKPIPEWNFRHNGTVLSSGVLIGDNFGAALNVTGTYARNAYHLEYGTYEAFIYTPEPEDIDLGG